METIDNLKEAIVEESTANRDFLIRDRTTEFEPYVGVVKEGSSPGLPYITPQRISAAGETSPLPSAIRTQIELLLASDSEVCVKPHTKGGAALSRSGKIFCLCEVRSLSFRVSPVLVESLLRTKRGRRCRPAPDRDEWGWITVGADLPECLSLLKDAYAFTFSLERIGRSAQISSTT